MNIMMLTRDFYPNIGGIATHTYELSRALVKKGQYVTIVNSFLQGKGHLVRSTGGVEVHEVHLSSSMLWSALKLAGYLKQLIDQNRPAVIHYHTIFPEGLAARMLKRRIPVVFTNHSSGYLRAVQTDLGRIKMNIHLDPHFIIAPSRELAEKSQYILPDNNRIVYIPNGVDTNKFNPRVNSKDVRKQLGIHKRDILILCPRRLDPKNGIIYAVKAMKHLIDRGKKAKLLVVGDGLVEEKNRIEAFIRTNHIENDVLLPGAVNSAAMPHYYSASDIVVLPSLMEATSISGLEAMACGKPLVGSRVGGIPALISDNVNGFLVAPRDDVELADKVTILLDNSSLRREQGKKSREIAETSFSWDIIAEKTLDVYRTLF